MAYEEATKTAVSEFIKDRITCLKTEICYLGTIKQRIHPDIVEEIIEDLCLEGHIIIKRKNIGKRTFTEVIWKGRTIPII